MFNSKFYLIEYAIQNAFSFLIKRNSWYSNLNEFHFYIQLRKTFWFRHVYPSAYVFIQYFLGAKLLYKSLCPSVRPSVRPSVPNTFWNFSNISLTNQNSLVLTFTLTFRSLHSSKIHFYLKVKVKVKEKISISP